MYQRYLQIVKPSDHVIEIGASNISRTKQIASQCANFKGIEYFEERLLPSDGNMRFIHGDWQRLSEVVQPNSIDIAVASHVIEHVPDDAAAIKELYTVLRPGGIALLNTPNRKRLPRTVIELVTGERKFPSWEHIREYIESDLTELLENSPFRQFHIEAVTFGIHAGTLRMYIDDVPQALRPLTNFWQVELQK
jgi:2-polyprenyl-3-methyl-5-hydroxy-6-metoxy-1,4-benzoquinol methylase